MSLPLKYRKNFYVLSNIRVINLSLSELKLIAQSRNKSDYENKSKKELVKALSEPKLKIRINKRKLEEIRNIFYELRQKFSKKKYIGIEKLQTSFHIRNKGGNQKS